MFTISDLQKSIDPTFYAYLRKKTDFVFLQNSYQEQSRFLWQHVVSQNNFLTAWLQLSQQEKDMLFYVLDNYGYVNSPPDFLLLQKLEKKFPYLFLHPLGGYFIPLEFFKLFMAKEIFAQKNYLFALLYKMRHENKDFAAFASRGFSVQASVRKENRILDTALAIYIWMAAKHLQEKQKNFSFLATLTQPNAHSLLHVRSYLPAKPINLWEYQKKYFPEEENNMEKLFSLLANGKKNFYRSLNLLPNPYTKMLRLFALAYVIPLLPASRNEDFDTQKIQIVCPREIFYNTTNPSFLRTKNKE